MHLNLIFYMFVSQYLLYFPLLFVIPPTIFKEILRWSLLLRNLMRMLEISTNHFDLREHTLRDEREKCYSTLNLFSKWPMSPQKRTQRRLVLTVWTLKSSWDTKKKLISKRKISTIVCIIF